MLLKNICNYKKELFIVTVFGIYVSLILWITLFGREAEYPASYWLPFLSYIRVFQGSWWSLIENIENILLFIPFGYLLQIISGNRKRVIAIVFGFSMFIEIVQLITGFGSFEVDDLIHNTIGGIIGIYISLKVRKRIIHSKLIWRYCIIITGLILIVSMTINYIIKYNHRQEMIKYAKLNNTVDKQNLLILNGIDGYAMDSDVYVKYLYDGSISIKGYSNIRTWYRLGQQALLPGTYEFAGLSDVEGETIAIELEYKDPEKGFIRLTEDIGPTESTVFSLSDKTIIRAFVGVYPGCKCDVIARPVIYRLGD